MVALRSKSMRRKPNNNSRRPSNPPPPHRYAMHRLSDWHARDVSANHPDWLPRMKSRTDHAFGITKRETTTSRLPGFSGLHEPFDSFTGCGMIEDFEKMIVCFLIDAHECLVK